MRARLVFGAGIVALAAGFLAAQGMYSQVGDIQIGAAAAGSGAVGLPERGQRRQAPLRVARQCRGRRHRHGDGQGRRPHQRHARRPRHRGRRRQGVHEQRPREQGQHRRSEDAGDAEQDRQRRRQSGRHHVRREEERSVGVQSHGQVRHADRRDAARWSRRFRCPARPRRGQADRRRHACSSTSKTRTRSTSSTWRPRKSSPAGPSRRATARPAWRSTSRRIGCSSAPASSWS